VNRSIVRIDMLCGASALEELDTPVAYPRSLFLMLGEDFDK